MGDQQVRRRRAATLPAAAASCARKSSTDRVCGTACTSTPASSAATASIRHANVTFGNTRSSASYGEPVPRTRGVSWLPLIATPRQAGVRELLETARGRCANVRYVGRAWSNMSPSQQEPVGLLPDRLLDGPVEGAQEVLLAHVASLVVAEMREVRPPEVGVAERDERAISAGARHSANPFDAPFGPRRERRGARHGLQVLLVEVHLRRERERRLEVRDDRLARHQRLDLGTEIRDVLLRAAPQDVPVLLVGQAEDEERVELRQAARRRSASAAATPRTDRP